DVIIAEYGNRFAGLDCVGEALRALVHVPEAGRIWQEIADPRVTVAGEVLARHAASEQQLVDEIVHAETGLARASPAPRLPGHRSFDVERHRHGGDSS